MALLTLAERGAPRQALNDASPLYGPFFDYYDTAITDPDLEPATMELCRLRLAQLLSAPGLGEPVPGASLAEGLAEAISGWPTDERVTDAQRTCLTFAEQFLIDAQGITDEQANEVRALLGDRGLAAFVLALGLIEQYQRLLLLLDPGLAQPDRARP